MHIWTICMYLSADNLPALRCGIMYVNNKSVSTLFKGIHPVFIHTSCHTIKHEPGFSTKVMQTNMQILQILYAIYNIVINMIIFLG